MAVLELDEAHALQFAAQVKPTHALLLNVARDQLDRFAEIDPPPSCSPGSSEQTTQRRRAQHRRLVRLADPRPGRRRGRGALLRRRPLDRRPAARAAGGRRPVRRRLRRARAGRRTTGCSSPATSGPSRWCSARATASGPLELQAARARRDDQRHRGDDDRPHAAGRRLPRGRHASRRCARSAAVRPRRGHRRRRAAAGAGAGEEPGRLHRRARHLRHRRRSPRWSRSTTTTPTAATCPGSTT